MKKTSVAQTNICIPLALSVLIVGGCSTVEVHKGEQDDLGPYMGTSRAIQKAKRVWNNYDYEFYGIFEFYAADVPACMILDTILLPYDVFKHLTYEPKSSGGGKEGK